MNGDRTWFWFDATLGAAVGIALVVVLQMLTGVYDAPSIHDTEGCVIISDGTVLHDPQPGEDDGPVYCPTGEVSVSQLGEVVR